MTTNLSQNASTLLAFLKETGGAWDMKCIEAFHPKPEYKNEPEAQKSYWQWDVNMYGGTSEKPVNGVLTLFTATDNYSAKVSAAYQELRKAGLASERNNGYNDYFLFAT